MTIYISQRHKEVKYIEAANAFGFDSELLALLLS